MKKITKIVLATSLLATSAFAGNQFIGVEGGYGFSSSIGGSVAETFKVEGAKTGTKSSLFGIKYGYDFGQTRTYVSYNYAPNTFTVATPNADKTKSDVKVTHLSKNNVVVGYDFTPEISDVFKASVGAFIGLSNVSPSSVKYTSKDGKIEDGSEKKDETKSFTTLDLGFKIGGLYSIDENNEIEFGYKLDRVSNNTYVGVYTHAAYVGYNYKF